MNSPIFRAILPLLLVATPALAWDPPNNPAKIHPKDIEVTLVPDKTSIMPGEPLYAIFVVKNISGHEQAIELSSQYIDGDARTDAIKLATVEKGGPQLPEFDWSAGRQPDYAEQHPGWEQKLPASGKVSFRVFVPWWVVFEHPGSYTITAAAKLYFRNKSNDFYDGVLMKGSDEISAPASATVEVVPEDKEQMGKLIDDLEQKASSDTDTQETREAIKKLESIPDGRVIPWLLKETKSTFPKRRANALYALARSANDAALDALKEILKSADSDDTRALICHALLYSPNPGAVPYLKTLGNEKNDVLAWYADILQGIEVSLVPEKPAILPGEPIYASLIVKNNSSRELTLNAFGDGTTSEGGMARNIELTAVDKDGVKAPAAIPPAEAAELNTEGLGYRNYSQSIPASGSITLRLFLPWRLVLERPGNYTLTAAATFRFFQKGIRNWADIPAKASAPLQVLPADKEMMGKLIDELKRQAMSVPRAIINGKVPPGYRESLDAVQKLRAMSGERAAAILKKYNLHVEGEDAYFRREYQTAIQRWSQALDADPKDATACEGRAADYTALKQWKPALADCEAAIKLAPDDPAAYEARGNVYHEKRMEAISKTGPHQELAEIADAEQAVADYAEAITLRSSKEASPEQWVRREGAIDGYQNTEKMIACDNVLLKLAPKDAARLYSSRGDAYERLWEWDKAIADYDEVLKLDPGNIRAIEQRARMNGQKQATSGKLLPGTMTDEIADLSELVRLKPVSASYVNRGEVYERAGDYEKAMADYNQALALSKGRDNGAYEGIAEIYVARGEWKKAIENYNHIIDTNDYGDLCNHAAIYDYRAMLYLNAGEYDKSIADVNKGMEGQIKSMIQIRAEDKADTNGGGKLLAMDEKDNRESMAGYLVMRGEAWLRAGNYAKALADFDAGIAEDGTGALSLNAKAWLCATCADAKFRDGAKAVELAVKACGFGAWKKAGDIDTLAAACAEAGKWQEALNYEKLAIKVAGDDADIPEHSAATEKQQSELIKSYNMRLAMYQQNKPFRGTKELVDWEE